jgi:hypothetical protein
MKAYQEGVQHEATILKSLTTYGWRVLDVLQCGDYGQVDGTRQLVCDLPVGPNAIIRCHPDGIAQCFKAPLKAEPGSRVRDRRWVEAKALRDGAWPDPMGKRQYAWQVSIEAAVTRLPGVFVIGWKDREGGLARVEPIWVAAPPFPLGAIKSRARHLLKLIEAAEDGVVPACDWAMWPCGFYATHDTGEGSVHYRPPAPGLPEEDERHMKAWVFKWRQARDMRGKWAGKEAAARDEMLGLLQRAGVGRWEGAGVCAAVAGGGVQKRFDVAAAKRDGVDVGKYQVEVPVKPHVKVAEVKEKAEDKAEEEAGDAHMAAS